MRKIDLIVIHCSATRVDRTLTAFDLETLHRRRGFNGTGYHYYIRKDGTTLLTRPIERIGHMQKDSMRRVSESAMKAVWTAGDARQIHGRRNNVPPSACWCINWSNVSPAAGCADTGISVRI